MKDRKKRQQRQSIIRFERRPIVTKKKTYSKIQSKSQQRLKSGVGLPPYAGNWASLKPTSRPVAVARPKRKVSSSRTLTVSKAQLNKATSKPTVQMRRRVNTRVPMQSKRTTSKAVLPPQKESFNLLQAERDIPFNWGDYPAKEVPVFEEKQIPVEAQHDETRFEVERQMPSLNKLSNNQYRTPALNEQEDDVEVIQPQSRFALPFTLQIWPKNIWSRATKKKVKFGLKSSKKFVKNAKTVNLAILIFGSLVIGGVMWNLQGIGRGLIAMNSAQGKAGEVYNHLLTAQSALAETDFDKTEAAFSDAENVLQEARQEIDEAFAASRYVLKWLDVTGTVRSGDKLLLSGEKLTQAGQHSARAFALLTSTKLVIGEVTNEESEDDVPLIQGIKMAKQEIVAATELLDEASEALNDVDSPLLPDDVSEKVETMQTAIPKVNKILKEFTSQTDVLLDVVGANHSRKYLLLFANNHEIRPVGGFMGSIGLVNVDKGVVEQIDIRSVYDVDGQLNEYISPPNPLLSVTDRWFMRDANWFVDYTVSAEKIAEFFEMQGGPTVDGVILMTPEVIRNLLSVTGEIEVPQHDLTVNYENFYVVTQDKVTYTYDQKINKPKQFLADLTPILLNRLFASEDKAGLEVIGALMKSLRQKDMLLYFKHNELQKNLEDLNFAGTLPEEAQGFLMVNNANIGGHKSDQFVEQEVDYRSEIKDNDDVEVVLTIRRTHHGPSEALDYDYPDNEDPAYKTNNIYQRVLVPKGAKLIDAKGFASSSDIPSTISRDEDLPLTVDRDVANWQSGQTRSVNNTIVGEEAGYDFFANWVVTKPGETSVALYRYVLPKHAKQFSLLDSAKRYSTYIAKQPGAMRTTIRASIEVPSGKKIVYTVPPEGITQHSNSSIVYRGTLQEDIMVGVVFSKE